MSNQKVPTNKSLGQDSLLYVILKLYSETFSIIIVAIYHYEISPFSFNKIF